ncbi:reverse transcriptase domain-containing protein [Tanacetum coccineum]
MSTRSSSSNLAPPFSDPESVIQNRRRNLGDPSLLLDFEEINMANNTNNVQGPPPAGPNFPAPDLRSMEELLQAPTDGVGDAIVVPPILANQFELKIGLLNLVTAIAFHAGVNILTKNTQEALTIIENKSKVQTSRNKPQVSSASGSSTQDAAITALTKQCQATDGYTQEDVYATTGTYNVGGNSYQPQVLHERPQGALPSNIEPNPREQVNSITTRSGLTTAEPSILPPVPPTPRVEPVSPPKPKEYPKPNPHQPKIPYPSRLNKTKILEKNDVQVSKFLKILKQLHFNISLMDALTQIPKFTKVLKDLLKDKEKLEELANTSMNVKCSAILLNKVPKKLGDPKKFLIPCVLQDLEVCSSLADARASINLMPLSIYEKLRIGPQKPTRMTLELANRSVTYLIGIDEDVIVRGDKFNFLANFVIVDFKVDPRVPIILGRPFLCTVKALVDLYEEKITLRIENEELVIHAKKFSKSSTSRECHSIHSINIIDSLCEEISNQNKQSSGSTTSHTDLSLPDYEVFCFEEKSSGSTTSHSDNSLPEYESCFFVVDHIEEKSSGSTTSHSDLSLLEYDLFHFDLLFDPCPPTDRILSSNVLPPQLLTSNSTLPEESSESSDITTLLSSPFKNEDKVQRIENKANTRVNIPSATSAADVAATWTSRTQSADVALPRRLTWDLHADVAADVACHMATWPC